MLIFIVYDGQYSFFLHKLVSKYLFNFSVSETLLCSLNLELNFVVLHTCQFVHSSLSYASSLPSFLPSPFLSCYAIAPTSFSQAHLFRIHVRVIHDESVLVGLDVVSSTIERKHLNKKTSIF